MQGLSIEQVQAVTGHKSDRMTEWYSHFDARQLANVMEAQEIITGAKKPCKAGETASGKAAGKTVAVKQAAADGKAGRVLPFPAKENAKKQKGA
jgi:hypothetical protein